MKKIFFKLFFLAVYLFTSSTLFHAGVMAHDMISDFGHHEQTNPCHQELNGFGSQPNGDCYEICLGVYDDVGGAISMTIDDVYEVQSHDNELFGNLNFTKVKTSFYTKTDPPPLALVGYGCIGKNVEKLE